MIPEQKTDIPPQGDRRRKTVVRFELSLATMMVMVLVAASLWLLIQLRPVVLVLIMALIVVGTMSPVVRWLNSHRVPRGAGIAIVFISFVTAAILLVALPMPKLLKQATNLIGEEPALRARAVDLLAASPLTAPFADMLREVHYDVLAKGAAAAIFSYSTRIMEIFAYGAGAFFLALYMMIDGDRLRGGLYAVVPRSYHIRLSRVLLHLETIVGWYIIGQLVTSALMVAFVFVLLTAFSVPNALAIAVLAGILDVLPYIGIFLAMVPTLLATLTVGPTVTIFVLAMMFIYGEFESRVLVPRIYGRVMRLPSSVVLFSLIAGAALMGVMGAFLALPVAATIRMLIEELGSGLPGEPAQVQGLRLGRRRDDYLSEEEYLRRTEGLSAKDAAAIAVEISRTRRKEDRMPYRTPEPAVGDEKRD